MKDIVIIGAGGVGKEVSWIIDQINGVRKIYKVLGFIDDNKDIWGKEILGYKVLGGLDFLEEINYRGCAAIAITDYVVKKNMTQRLNNLEIEFPIIKHPKVKVPESTTIGQGSIIYEGVIISPDVKIGNFVIVSPKCGIGHDSVIEDYVSLLWNVSISGNDHIEEGVLFGSASTIIQGKKVKNESIIGAGAVVVKDIEKKGTYVGVPSKEIEV